MICARWKWMTSRVHKRGKNSWITFKVFNKNRMMLSRVLYMLFIETWVDGIFSPEMWSCFGRMNEHTNNSQEAYNSVLNM